MQQQGKYVQEKGEQGSCEHCKMCTKPKEGLQIWFQRCYFQNETKKNEPPM